jgi:hypothetical protein
VKLEAKTGTFGSFTTLAKSLLARFIICSLLVAVAGLATMAKNGQYFPETSAAHYVSISTKMNVAHPPVLFAGDHLQPAALLFTPQPPMRAIRVDRAAAPPPIVQLCLIDSKQLRAPPAARL